MKEFQIAGASVPGMDHTMPGEPGWKNNQDALAWRVSPDRIVAVVCDGCSSMEHSEVGARLGACIIADAMSMLPVDRKLALSSDKEVESYCRELMTDTLERVDAIVLKLGAPRREMTENHFLFAMVALVITPDATMIISCGDGVYAVNDMVTVIGPFPGNAPPYLAYNLLSSRRYEFVPQILCRTADVQSVCIGTDGVADLIRAGEVTIPRLKQSVGPLNQFWRNDAYFKNQDQVRRRLALINLDTVIDGRIKRGPLRDDTTLVVVRRAPFQGEIHA